MRVDRRQIVKYRLAVNHLSEGRMSREKVAEAAGGGLQDGSPWSGLLSLHCRVRDLDEQSWRDPQLAQVFGPRGAIYLVPAADVGVFTLGVAPIDPARLEQTRLEAAAISELLEEGPLSQSAILRALPSLKGSRAVRWAGTAGTILPTWDTVDTVVRRSPPPAISTEHARQELGRRFFRFLGPATVADLAWWLEADVTAIGSTFEAIEGGLSMVDYEGSELFVTSDTTSLLAQPPEPRQLLVLPPDEIAINRRTGRQVVERVHASRLWPKAPPPGGLLMDGEVVGTWRRRGRHVSVDSWSPLTASHKAAVHDLVAGFPLRGDPSVTFVNG